jgi:hypothetical protein
MPNLLTVEEAKLLPEGKLREKELKKVDNIFSDDNVEIAAEIVLGIGDICDISCKADVLERAYKYGWNKSKDTTKQNEKETNKIILRLGFIVVFSGVITLSTLFNIRGSANKKVNKVSKEINQEFVSSKTLVNNICSHNQEYCFSVVTKGKTDGFKRYQNISSRVVNTKTDELVYEEHTPRLYKQYIFESPFKLTKEGIKKYKNSLAEIYQEDYYAVSNNGDLLTIQFDHNNLPLYIHFYKNNKIQTRKTYNRQDIDKILNLENNQPEKNISDNLFDINNIKKPTAISGSNNMLKIDLGIDISLLINLETGQLAPSDILPQ